VPSSFFLFTSTNLNKYKFQISKGNAKKKGNVPYLEDVTRIARDKTKDSDKRRVPKPFKFQSM